MDQPTFLPLLNAIAVNEAKGQRLLDAWANVTPDVELAGVLRFVAIREGEHAMAFTKRMCELGYAVCEQTAFQVFKDFDRQLTFIGSNASDTEKVLRSRSKSSAEPRKDPFVGFFNDTSIDPLTGELLGRFICEERDSERRLQAAYDRVSDARSRAAKVDELHAGVHALMAAVEKLKMMRNVA